MCRPSAVSTGPLRPWCGRTLRAGPRDDRNTAVEPSVERGDDVELVLLGQVGAERQAERALGYVGRDGEGHRIDPVALAVVGVEMDAPVVDTSADLLRGQEVEEVVS